MKSFLLSAFFWAIASCSGGGGGDPVETTAEGACSEYALASCTFDQRCDPYSYRVWNGDPSACLARSRSDCFTTLGVSGSLAKPDDMHACAVRIGQASCDDVFYGSGWPEECRPRGLFADGAPCGLSVQCRSGRCGGAGATTCGTCASQVPDGAPCVATANCGRNSVCDQQVCVPRVPLGASCGPGAVCLGWLECSGAASATGVCSKLPGLGAACSPNVGDPCDPFVGVGLVCDTATLTCTGEKSIPIGEACSTVDPSCGIEGYCQLSADGGNGGVCRALLKDGAPCTAFDECIGPSTCINSVCTPPDPGRCHPSL
jgi:hypothetical protein